LDNFNLTANRRPNNAEYVHLPHLPPVQSPQHRTKATTTADYSPSFLLAEGLPMRRVARSEATDARLVRPVLRLQKASWRPGAWNGGTPKFSN